MPGEHRLEFGGWRFNCAAVGDDTRTVVVRPAEILQTDLEIECDQAPPAGPGRELVFATRRDGVGELYRVNDDGTGLLRITTDQTDHEPTWSPDGSRIALRINIHTLSGPNNGEVLIIKPDGTDLTNITNDLAAFDVTPAWNGAGTHIIYARTSLAEQIPDELYVMAADGSGKTRLTRGWRPSWSPDGTRIVFVDSLGVPSTDLYVVAPDGTRRAALMTTPDVSEVDPEWSPDNARIAFASDRTGRFEVYVMNMDGSGTIQLTSGATGDRRDPAWAPDGKRIAFVSEDGTSRDLYVISADGSDVRRLTYGGGWEPSWRP
jgi:TolB protein